MNLRSVCIIFLAVFCVTPFICANEPAQPAHVRSFLAALGTYNGNDEIINFNGDAIKPLVVLHPELRNERLVFDRFDFEDGHPRIYDELVLLFLRQGDGWDAMNDKWPVREASDEEIRINQDIERAQQIPSAPQEAGNVIEAQLNQVAHERRLFERQEDLQRLGEELQVECQRTQAMHDAKITRFKNVLQTSWDVIHQEALAAIDAKNLFLLKSLIVQTPSLLKPPAFIRYQTTLLHRAAERFSQADPVTVQIFAQVMRLDAPVEAVNNVGQTVVAYIQAHKPEMKACYDYELIIRTRSNDDGLNKYIERVRQQIEPQLQTLMPYKNQIIIGGIVSLVLGYFFLSSGHDNVEDDAKTEIAFGKLE